jgi:hypothetical protein
MNIKKKILPFLIILTAFLPLLSCSRLGWGVLLWTIEDPLVLSGTVLPVYIRSNIEHLYVVGVPDPNRRIGEPVKIEVPLSMFEFSGSKRKAEKRAEEFSQFAAVYAENLQDGLPIRDYPDNNSRRVYRLRLGEIIKILNITTDGSPPISTTGDPLPGDWYLVLTEDGITGYCFSYRLKIFDHYEGSIRAAAGERRETVSDPDLDIVLSKKWSPEFYFQMVSSRQINTEEFEKNYRFDPGQDTGIARIIMPDMEREFVYDGIYPDGERAWRFEGVNLSMNLRSNNTLAVQFLDSTGARRTLLFVSLSSDVNDLIMQENTRRQAQYMTIYNQGPVFTSTNYGTITFTAAGNFTWTGFDSLVPQYISSETKGQGRVYMDLFLSPSFEERYNGAFTLRFTDIRQNNTLCFMYNLDNQGLRLEVVPDYGIEDSAVTRRSASPMVLYFYRDAEF